MIADGDGTAKELEKLMVLPWRNLAGPLMLRRNELRANPQRSNAVIKFRELRDLQRYFMAVVDRPCGCATCEAQKRIRKALVSEGMTPSVPQNLDSELAKYAEKCERKSAIHQLELDDYYPSALICLNYAQLLRPKTEVQPQGDGQAKNLHPCVCELIWLRRRLPDDLITKVQTVWDLIDWCESWEDDLEPKIKAEKGSCATFDVVNQLYAAKSCDLSESQPASLPYHFDRQMLKFLCSGPDRNHMHTCANLPCSKIEWFQAEMKVCGRCRKDQCGLPHFYCSEDCQREDWAKQHRFFHQLLESK